MNQEFDVAIVGAGLTGSTLALLLGQMCPRMKIAVLEKGAGSLPELVPSPHHFLDITPRVSAISLASRAILNRVGVWDSISQQHCCPYLGMQVSQAHGSATLRFDAEDINESCLGYIAENRTIQAALSRQWAKYPNLQIYTNQSLTWLRQNRDSIQIGLKDGSFKAKLVVGADGADSQVRQLGNFNSSAKDYRHTALVAHLKTQYPHQWQARQIFLETGPLAFLPLSLRSGLEVQTGALPASAETERYVSIVWSGPADMIAQLQHADEMQFLAGINQWMPEALGQALEVSRRYGFPLRRAHANHYIQRRMVLVGDAAHVIHPLAGQGVNLGFLDVAHLANILEQGFNAEVDIGDESWLRQYERPRKCHNQSMLMVTDMLYKLYRSRPHWLARLAANQGLHWLNYLAPIKQHLIEQASGHRLHLPDSYKSFHHQWAY